MGGTFQEHIVQQLPASIYFKGTSRTYPKDNGGKAY